MAQQNKPHRRTARDAGLTSKSTRYSLPGEKRKKPIVPIVAIAAVAIAAIGVIAFMNGGGPGGDVPGAGQTEQQQTAQTQQGGGQDQSAAQEQGNASGEKAGSSAASGKGDAASSESGSDSKTSSDKSSSKSSNTSSNNSSAGTSGSSSDNGGADEGHDADSYKTSVADAQKVDAPNFDDEGSGTDSAQAGGSNGSSGASSSSGDEQGSQGQGSSQKTSKAWKKACSYYNALKDGSDQITAFVEDVYNTHLYSSLSKRKADHKKFKKLRASILASLQDSKGAWTISKVKASGEDADLVKDEKKASDLLARRMEIIDAGYKAINALSSKASHSKIDKAHNKACADSAPTYNSFVEVMESIANQVS